MSDAWLFASHTETNTTHYIGWLGVCISESSSVDKKSLAKVLAVPFGKRKHEHNQTRGAKDKLYYSAIYTHSLTHVNMCHIAHSVDIIHQQFHTAQHTSSIVSKNLQVPYQIKYYIIWNQHNLMLPFQPIFLTTYM